MTEQYDLIDAAEINTQEELDRLIDPRIVEIVGDEILPVIQVEALQYLSTPDGYLAIGDTLYKSTRKTTEARLISTTPEAAVGSPIVAVFPNNYTQDLISRDDKACDRGTGRRRRMKGEFQINNTVLVNEVKVITKHQRRILGTWTRSSTNSLRHEAFVTFKSNGRDWDSQPRRKFNQWDNQAHISSHMQITAIAQPYICDKNYRHGSATHEAQRDGTWHECSTRRCD